MAKYYFNSEDIKVYPSGFRSSSSDVESKLSTEENITLQSFGEDKFFFENPRNSGAGKYIAGIQGYKFIFDKDAVETALEEAANLTAGTDIYLGIKLVNLTTADDDSGSNYGKFLANCNTSSTLQQDLRALDVGGKFYGCCLLTGDDAVGADSWDSAFKIQIGTLDEESETLNFVGRFFLDIDHNSKINLKSGNLEDINAISEGNISLSADKSIEIFSTEDLNINSSGSISLASTGNISINKLIVEEAGSGEGAQKRIYFGNDGFGIGKDSKIQSGNPYGVVIGKNASVLYGTASTAVGGESNASGDMATAFGYYSNASGCYATSVGGFAKSLNESATSVGHSSKALGKNSIAVGERANSSNDSSVAIGNNAKSTKKNSIQLGNGTNSNESTLQFLNNTIANDSCLLGHLVGSVEGDVETQSISSNGSNLLINENTIIDSVGKKLSIGDIVLDNTSNKNDLSVGNVSLNNIVSKEQNGNVSINQNTNISADGNRVEIGNVILDGTNSYVNASTFNGDSINSKTLNGNVSINQNTNISSDGKTLTTNKINAVRVDSLYQNTSDIVFNDGIVTIGLDVTANSISPVDSLIAIGRNASTYGVRNKNAIVIGNSASVEGGSTTGNNSIAIGTNASIQASEASIAFGENSKISSGTTKYTTYSMAIGRNASVNASSSDSRRSIAIGAYSKVSANNSIAIGNYANASSIDSIAIGNNSIASASEAIQIGSGTNSVEKTLQFRGRQIVDLNGNISANYSDYSENTNLLKTADNTYSSFSQIKQLILEQIYPVGSMYISLSKTDPATVLGFGTWSPIDGYSLWADKSDQDFFSDYGTVYRSPSLPNISGSFTIQDSNGSNQLSVVGCTGAFTGISKTDAYGNRYTISTEEIQTTPVAVTFDAHQFDSTYGNIDGKVIPTSIKCHIWYRAS